MEQIKELRDLLTGQKLGVLATTEADRAPYLSLVAFAVTPELDAIIFATPRASRKFDNLVARPRVALLIDSRSPAADVFSAAAAATAYGRAAEPAGPEREALAGLLLGVHPSLSDFLHDPGTALVRIQVERYQLVTHFQKTQEIRMGAKE